MSGHSKWASIKHKKGALDAKRGKAFTKIIREISIAARLGGGDSGSNPRLRTAIDKAKGVNMPADNIKRAIQKGTGDLEGAAYEDFTLEGYGPGGVAVLVEGTSDNRNRTVAEIRHIFSKHNGNLGTAGCVAYLFSPRGLIVVPTEKISEDDLMSIVLDRGADDIQGSESSWEIYAPPDSYEAVLDALKASGIEPESSQLGKFASTNVPLEGAKAQQMLKLMEALEDNDDVQNVWANFDISDKEFEAAAS
ncbi:MAG: YebC/PmpR family DNA-binding transcriptional regulator [Vicinamibacteria bacterium]|nr:YebC/PmpR family DNA-binding transcriptional regulator [Vicinamibacteria bacterium]